MGRPGLPPILVTSSIHSLSFALIKRMGVTQIVYLQWAYVMNKFESRVAMLQWNKGLWLDDQSQLTSLNQSDSFISPFSYFVQLCTTFPFLVSLSVYLLPVLNLLSSPSLISSKLFKFYFAINKIEYFCAKTHEICTILWRVHSVQMLK